MEGTSCVYFGIIILMSVHNQLSVEGNVLEQPCRSPQDCVTPSANLTCNVTSEQCVCSSGYIKQNNECKQIHAMECNQTEPTSCDYGLSCAIGNGNYSCLCNNDTFWVPDELRCISVENIGIIAAQEVTTGTTSVTLAWAASNYSQDVNYDLTWGDSEIRQNVTSPTTLEGLTPGVTYNFTIISYLPKDNHYTRRETMLIKTVTMTPAQPGHVDETASNLLQNPMTVVFGESEGVVDHYRVIVTSTSDGSSKTKDTLTNKATLQLESGTVYNYAIYAFNSDQETSKLSEGTFKTQTQNTTEAPPKRTSHSGERVDNIILVVGIVSAMSAFGLIVLTVYLIDHKDFCKKKKERNFTSIDGNREKIAEKSEKQEVDSTTNGSDDNTGSEDLQINQITSVYDDSMKPSDNPEFYDSPLDSSQNYQVKDINTYYSKDKDSTSQNFQHLGSTKNKSSEL